MEIHKRTQQWQLDGDEEQLLRVEIVQECFVEVDDSVLGVCCQEFFQAKLLDE